LKLTQLTLYNFQSFGPTPTVIAFESLTFLIGPNGAGKTAVLQALARLFAFDPALRRVRKTDFHIMRSDPTGPPSSGMLRFSPRRRQYVYAVPAAVGNWMRASAIRPRVQFGGRRAGESWRTHHRSGY
jgi:predicted ATP-dependent endonuclease of OLD family